MSVASILCVDGEADIHDTARGAVAAALARRADAPKARIGIATGDIELGDPLGFANRLAELAEPGQILMSDSVRRAIARDDHLPVDLGAVSLGRRIDRVHVFELGGARVRSRTAFGVDLYSHGRDRDKDTLDSELHAYDELMLKVALRHSGFLESVDGVGMRFAFARIPEAMRAAIEIQAEWTASLSHVGTLRFAVDVHEMHYLGDRWHSAGWIVVDRLVDRLRYGHLAVTDAVFDALGVVGLSALGLSTTAPREEVPLKGRARPVGVRFLPLQ